MLILFFDLIIGLVDTITKTVKDAIQAAKPAPGHPVLFSSSYPTPLVNQIGKIKVSLT